MATSDMSLGGGAGFGTGYTPIQFAPLVSLTGPVMAPATPAAPEAAAPMAPALRLLQMSDMPDNAYMTGEMQQGTPGAGFVNPFSGMSGSQIARTGMDALSFFTNPLGFAAQYALTGQTPSQNFQGLFSGGLQGLLGGGGQQAAEVPLGSSQAGLSSQGLGMGSAAFNDALSMGESMGLAPEFSQQAASAAATMVAQGVDPSTALTMALLDASTAASQAQSSAFDIARSLPAAPAETGGGFAPSDFGGAGITEGFTGDALGMGGGQAPY